MNITNKIITNSYLLIIGAWEQSNRTGEYDPILSDILFKDTEPTRKLTLSFLLQQDWSRLLFDLYKERDAFTKNDLGDERRLITHADLLIAFIEHQEPVWPFIEPEAPDAIAQAVAYFLGVRGAASDKTILLQETLADAFTFVDQTFQEYYEDDLIRANERSSTLCEVSYDYAYLYALENNLVVRFFAFAGFFLEHKALLPLDQLSAALLNFYV